MPEDNNQVQQADCKQRRKKASRACSHCQKAHLTCDDSRPCQRCIKRGLEDTCMDGTRKKAKYLQEDKDSDQHFSPHSLTPPVVLGYQAESFYPMQRLSYPAENFEFGSASTTPVVADSSYQNSISNSLDSNWKASAVDPNSIVLNSTNTSPSLSSLPPGTPLGHFQLHDVNDNNKMYNGSNQKTIRRRKGVGNTPDEIYRRVQKPYNYAESYHHLIEYARHRMGRNELLRISRALVLFRPSYMSMVAALTEEDLVYMEKCVQRTLLEFEKLISFSGTPTILWRRTGEIVLVGKEFLLLTQWSKEALLGKKTYIYELMDNGSAIEYWEKFSQHAFDNAESAVYMSVILMGPTFRPVPCSVCFTVKRDIFDLPCVVVGNFLPILGANTAG